MKINLAFKMLLLAGTCLLSVQNSLADTKYGGGGGKGGTSADGIAVGGEGGGISHSGGQGGGMNSTGAFPPNDGNGGDGTNNAKGGGGEERAGSLGPLLTILQNPYPISRKPQGKTGGFHRMRAAAAARWRLSMRRNIL